MKKNTIKIIAALAFIFGLVGLSAPVFAEGENAEGKKENTTDTSTHPEGEADALSGKIQEISPDAPPVLIQVSPVSSQVILEAGKTSEHTMTIRNSGSSDFSYTLYATPYSITNENYDVDFTTETPRTQIARWIKFYQGDKIVDKPKFTIKSGETQLVKYLVEVPADIPAGGQYATIFAETEAGVNSKEVTQSDNSGIRTASRVGMIVYGRTNGDTTEEGSITDFNIPGFLTSGNITATSKVKNSGNTDFEAEYIIAVKSILGAELYKKQSSYNILPDTERRVNLEWADTPFMGIFKVYFKVHAPGNEGTREEEKLVIKFPIIMIILTILVLTGLTIGIIMVVRKRRERNSRLAV
ncbi:hypothetical protein IKG73_00885 [Candidatus Saccharibacteria bacterium]|nr:hypothetical protein [Candidatus Saccharibacteria bacterium]